MHEAPSDSNVSGKASLDRLSLPFYAAPDVLPAPLPTAEAIAASQDVLLEYGNRRIVRVGDHFLVKYGVGVSLVEGENMLFVAQNTAVKVPAVYALYSQPDRDSDYTVNYIVMENIKGECLEATWGSLDMDTKVHLAAQLRCYFSELRRITSPDYFGVAGRRPFEDAVFWTGDEDDTNAMSGPFSSQAEMLEAVVQVYLRTNNGHSKADYYRRVLPSVLGNQPPVFTHGDVQKKNIMVQPDGKVVLVDWEAAGWYPHFWEYSMTMFSCRWKDDWHVWVPEMLDEYLNEFAWMNMIFRELWS